MKHWIAKNKWVLIITACFVTVRLVIFIGLWEVGPAGGWNNFYLQTYLSQEVLSGQFFDTCDWHPPLYYMFTGTLLLLFKTQWAIYCVQFLLDALLLYIAFKLARLVLPEKGSYAAVLIYAVEPYWAMQTFVLTSEHVSTPLLLGSLYFFLSYFKNGKNSALNYASLLASGALLSLATATRLNSLLMAPLLIALVLFFFLFRRFFRMDLAFVHGFKHYVFAMLIFFASFAVILAPFYIRHHSLYGRWDIANMASSNIYNYNLAPLLVLRNNISYDTALRVLHENLRTKLGEPYSSTQDCRRLSKREYRVLYDFYSQESKRIILDNWPLYLRMHLIKTLPFFVESGYYNMWASYTGEFSKPDITNAVIKGDFSAVKGFIMTGGGMFYAYFIGLIFWGLCSLSVFVGFLYALFRKPGHLFFFSITVVAILYNALLISPFVLARYRFPLYPLFFIALVYAIFILFTKKKDFEK